MYIFIIKCTTATQKKDVWVIYVYKLLKNSVSICIRKIFLPSYKMMASNKIGFIRIPNFSDDLLTALTRQLLLLMFGISSF